MADTLRHGPPRKKPSRAKRGSIRPQKQQRAGAATRGRTDQCRGSPGAAMSNVVADGSAATQAMSAWICWVVVIAVDTTMTAPAVAKEP